ncbi:MAG: ABC transporter ATP-binding protein [Bacteroidetes bacterium]|nr:ABC transporter ATP-binding protein [Bacteroidota bacterium]
MSNKIQVESVSKQYGMAPPIIKSISYTFESGKISGLRGNNGSGKSTFLKLIACTLLPDSGEILYNELSIHRSPEQYLSKIGVVADWVDLPEYLSFDELIIWKMERLNYSSHQIKEKTNELKELFSFDERSQQLIGTYSSGMKKKTALSVAVCTNPDVLILDEPFVALDVHTQGILAKFIVDLKKSGKIILLASHDEDHEEELFDIVIDFPMN